MNKFIEIPATKRSLTQRALVYGVGINDSEYMTSPVVDGKRIFCPFYVKWKSMLQRCYDPKELNRNPCYIDCYVCDEWLLFSNFKRWMKTQEWKGLSLDKDILKQGNKIYCPMYCFFISPAINTLIGNKSYSKGGLPTGVTFRKDTGNYVAELCINGKTSYIGKFKTPELAHGAYKKEKYKHIFSVANEQKEPLRSALLSYVIM